MLSFCLTIFLKRAYYLDKTIVHILNVAYLLRFSMYVIHRCSKFTPVLFCMTCLNNQSSEAILYNMLYFREWEVYVFFLQVTSS